MFARRSLAHCKTKRAHSSTRFSSRLPPPTDDLGLPLSPTWSVHKLIGSYPSPTLSDATLRRLYDSAALLAPKSDTHAFEEVKKEMEDLIRLVEAVKMAPGDDDAKGPPPDGRVWPSGRGIIPLEDIVESEETKLPSGRELLKHAPRTVNGYYLVDRASTKT